MMELVLTGVFGFIIIYVTLTYFERLKDKYTDKTNEEDDDGRYHS